MTTTHVFIVDATTFKYHLEYLFAGTGAKDKYIDFNNQADTKLHHSAENNLVGMIADSQRLRSNDFVVFYLQKSLSSGINDGKFFGIFKIKKGPSFLDNNDPSQYLKNNLNKSLTFRVLIEPYRVFPKGVTEWEALDEIKNISSPHQMLWSLIYRKLKGNRGNTMITLYESERLFDLLEKKNKDQFIDGEGYSFNISSQKIITLDRRYEYQGRKEAINILPRLLRKYHQNMAFEGHLQTYILQNIGKGFLSNLDEIILENYGIEWLGNEVSCGVGMQRIDVMLSLINTDGHRVVVPIELKAVEGKTGNVIQIQRYVDWIEQYYIPNRNSDIQPVLIARNMENKESTSFKNLLASFKDFNGRNSECLPLKYIEFYEQNELLIFKEISY